MLEDYSVGRRTEGGEQGGWLPEMVSDGDDHLNKHDEDIDAAMQFGCGHPMGPITLSDYVGLDTTLSIIQGWCERYPDDSDFSIPDSLRRLVQAGKFGRKTGEGYYEWDGDKKKAKG